MNQWFIQRHANLSFHQACSSAAITPQEMEVCIRKHGIEHTSYGVEVDDQHTTALRILCTNPHGTGDAIRVYLTLASEAAD